MKTVVIDGDLNLITTESAELNLITTESAELGVFTVIHGERLPAYTGETIVTPKAFEQQTLETDNTSVYSDITVLEIPYTEVSNLSGGYTVSIG